MRTTLRLHALTFALLLLAACGGDESAPGNPTATAPEPAPSIVAATAALPTPAPDLKASFRDFLSQVDGALQARDMSFFSKNALARPVTCTAINVRSRLRIGGCDREGQQFDGIDVALWRSDQGSPVPVDAAASLVARLWNETQQGSDEFGPSAPRVYALAMTPNAPEGSPQAAAVLTAMIRPPAGANPPTTVARRVVLVTHWRQVQGQWRLMIILDATTALAEDFLRPSAEGRSYIGSWERYQP